MDKTNTNQVEGKKLVADKRYVLKGMSLGMLIAIPFGAIYGDVTGVSFVGIMLGMLVGAIVGRVNNKRSLDSDKTDQASPTSTNN